MLFTNCFRCLSKRPRNSVYVVLAVYNIIGKHLKMNKIRISNFIIKQAIQSAVLRSNQLSSLNRFAFYSSTPKNDDIQSKNPKLKISPKVTMINPDDKIEVVTLEQAKKIANRRDLKLVSILDMDTKTNRPVYK